MGKRTHPHQITAVFSPEELTWIDAMVRHMVKTQPFSRFRKDGANQPWTRAGVLRHLVELAMKEHT